MCVSKLVCYFSQFKASKGTRGRGELVQNEKESEGRVRVHRTSYISIENESESDCEALEGK